MSYCRFSSDNWKSDVYCYESEMGIVINVAGSKIDGIPEIPSWGIVSAEEYMEAMKVQSDYMDKHQSARREIGLPYDGQYFLCGSYQQAYEKLVELKEVGYYVPEYAITNMKEDAENENC